MRKITVETEAPKIEINGIVFEYRMSDGEIYWMGRDVLAKCVALNISNESAILDALNMICGAIDHVLGNGAMAKIMDGKPVSMNAALKVLNGIIADCNARYTAYLRREYTGGGADA
jgi:hypothetical protein